MRQIALPNHDHKNGNGRRESDLDVGLTRPNADLKRRLASFELSTTH